MDSQITFRCNKEDICRWKAKASAWGYDLASFIRLKLDEETSGGPKAVREPAQPKQPDKTAAVRQAAPVPVTSSIDPFSRIKPQRIDYSKSQLKNK